MSLDTDKLFSEKLYSDYKRFFKYGYSRIRSFYLCNKNRFKSISMDFNDLVQELYPIIFEVIKTYDKKYKNIEKVHLEKHIKDRVLWALLNILRSKKSLVLNKLAVNEEYYLVEDTKNENISKIPDLFVVNLINKFCKTEKERDVITLKIVKNLTFKEIGERKKISKQRAGQIFKSIISRMKKKIRSYDDFYDKI